MARAIWNGDISFGLIGIQVELFSATASDRISFHLVDKRDGARIRYQRVNEDTGEEVPWSQIEKSYQNEKGDQIILEKAELEEFEPKLTKTVELEEFIDLEAISPLFFDTPYYLVPGKRSQKSYVLLRETLRQANKCGMGRVVIRTKEHLCIIFPLEDVLVLHLLHFPEEIKDFSEYELPKIESFENKIRANELDLSYQLIKTMSEPWNPDKYHATYKDRLMKWIEEKMKSGVKIEKPEHKKASDENKNNVINIEDLLKKSLKSNKNQKRSKSE